MIHQYVDRTTGALVEEELLGDRLVGFLYSHLREDAPRLFRALTGRRFSSILAYVNFDLPLGWQRRGVLSRLRGRGLDLSECVVPASALRTPRQIFERQIRYWDCRPMPADPATVVSPADARVLVGSLCPGSGLFVKAKFFELSELLGQRGGRWLAAFAAGDYAVLRLTPERYHYSHTPVAGRVVDLYEVGGAYHSCNPGALVELADPHSRNRRVVTLIQTDVPGGTGVGLVAMLEVVALMIGDVVQCYSPVRYDAPRPIDVGAFVQRGVPKSRYRPGSSTDVLLFEPGRVVFESDLLGNQVRADAQTRFSRHAGRPMTETDVRVRSALARARQPQGERCRPASWS